MNSKVPDWVIVGDKSKYVVLKWLFPETVLPNMNEFNIIVQNGQNYVIRIDHNLIVLETPKLLTSLVLYLPCDYLRIKSIPKYVNIGVFESSPYGKYETEVICKYLKDKHPTNYLKIFLVDIPQKNASTDLDAGSNYLLETYNKYVAANHNVEILSSDSYVNDELLGSVSSIDYCNQRIKKSIEFIREKLDNDFLFKILYYDCYITESLYGDAIARSINEYKKFEVYRAKNRNKYINVWDYYKDSCIAIYAPEINKGGLYAIDELYESLFKESMLGFLDLKTEPEALRKRLCKKLSNLFDKEIQHINPVRISNKKEYLEYITKMNLVPKLQDLINNFVGSTIYDEVKRMILEKCIVLEKGVSK